MSRFGNWRKEEGGGRVGGGGRLIHWLLVPAIVLLFSAEPTTSQSEKWKGQRLCQTPSTLSQPPSLFPLSPTVNLKSFHPPFTPPHPPSLNSSPTIHLT